MKAWIRTFLAAVALIGAAWAAGSGIAQAHPVGDATEPNCHGQRVSHGASHSPVHAGHGLTPVERRDAIEAMFGEELTVGEWNKFIKTCPPPPPGP
jgi:hypothetical protein